MDNTTRARKLAKWLQRQEWFEAWRNNLFHCYCEPEDYDIIHSFMNGREGVYTIEQAFRWETSPEGKEFWAKANVELKTFMNKISEDKE